MKTKQRVCKNCKFLTKQNHHMFISSHLCNRLDALIKEVNKEVGEDLFCDFANYRFDNQTCKLFEWKETDNE